MPEVVKCAFATRRRRVSDRQRGPALKGRAIRQSRSACYSPALKGRGEGGHTMKPATGTTVITNGRLFDGTGAPPVRDAALVIRDGVIAYAGPVAGAPVLSLDARRIDAKGGTILPGLIEAHYHPTYFNV